MFFLLCSDQHGFFQGLICKKKNLAVLQATFIRTLKSTKVLDDIYLDFFKAINSENHTHFIHKITEQLNITCSLKT